MSKQIELTEGQFKSYLQGFLREGVVEVGFTKKDGTDRRMNCTLINIPEDKQPKGEVERKESDDYLAVFDIDKQDWRSFRLDSIFEVNANGQQIMGNLVK